MSLPRPWCLVTFEKERKSLRAWINSVGISGGNQSPQPPSLETGGISDRNSEPLSPSQAATAVGTGTLQASLSQEPCSPQGPGDAGICSLCLIQKCLVLGKAFWACCIRHLFYRVFRTGLNSGFPKLGKDGKWFPVVAG